MIVFFLLLNWVSSFLSLFFFKVKIPNPQLNTTLFMNLNDVDLDLTEIDTLFAKVQPKVDGDGETNIFFKKKKNIFCDSYSIF